MLVLFDIDGTLLHTQGAGRESTRDAMIEVFGTCSTIETHQFGGKTDWYTLIELLTPHGITPQQIADRMAHYDQVVGRHLERIIAGRSAAPLPGALEAVQTLRSRPDVVLGIVTGNCTSTANIKLRAAGFDPAWFPIGAYGSEAIERDHLTPIALQRAIDHSRRHFHPDQTVVIGDTVADIQCGRVIGARVIAVATGHNSRDDLIAARPDHLLDDLTTLLNVL